MGVKLVKEEQSVKVLHANVPGLIILMIGCVALMAWSIYQATDDKRFSKTCERTEGVVVDYEMYYDEDDDERYVGIYEYTVNGVTYEVEEDDWHISAPEAGEKANVYYDPEHPEDARLTVGGLDSTFKAIGMYTMCAMGGIFFFIALAMLLAHYKVPTPWIQLLVGVAFTLLGIGIPILTLGSGCPLIIWGLIGIYLVIKGYLQLRGKEEEEQELEDAVRSAVGSVVNDLAGNQTQDLEQMQENEYTVETVVTAAKNVERIANFMNGVVSGISCLLIGLIFPVVGITLIIIMPVWGKLMGVAFVIAGLAALIFGIWVIIRSLGKR